MELFDRSTYRPSLTDYGRSFLEKSHKIISGMQELEGMSKSFREKEEPEICISIDGICLNTDLLKLFKSFSERHPNTKLNLSLDILSEAERKVLNKTTQIGVSHFIHEPNSLEMVPITTVNMLPVMNKDLFKEKKVRHESDLQEIDQIVVRDKNGPKGVSFGLLEAGKKWQLLDANFKREIILAGLGWGHLPEQSIEREIKEKKLVVLNFDGVHPRELKVNLIRLKKQQLGPIAKKLWEELISFHL